MKTGARDRRERLRAMLADLKLPGEITSTTCDEVGSIGV